MSMWREIRYYAKGTPTKTTKRLRRQHLWEAASFGTHKSPCGLSAFGSQLRKSTPDTSLCGNCVFIINAREKAKKKAKVRPRGKDKGNGRRQRQCRCG